MLKIQYYSWEELEKELKVKFTKTNGRAKLIDRNIAPYYQFEIVKDGRKNVGINIFGGSSKSKFIRLCEEVAGKEVKFPNEETAKSLLKLLVNGDKTIFSYDALGKSDELDRSYERHTVSLYLNTFREIGILPKQKELIKSTRFVSETGELLGKAIDPNKWTYYKVFQDDRKEISYMEYIEMHDFIRDVEHNMLLPLIDEANSDAEVINENRQYCKKQAIFACINHFGYLPKRAFSKELTEKAKYIFKDYFTTDSSDVVEKSALIEESVETDNNERLFKQFIKEHEFMLVHEVKEMCIVEAEKLSIEKDPFTGQLEIYNEKNNKWEKYVENDWVNGEKIEREIITVPDIPQFIKGKESSALKEMLNSYI